MATLADFDRLGNYARMYNQDQNIDRHQCTRTVPLQVLCLGFSRTGTLSMREALTALGYPNVYHFSSMYDNVQDSDMWLELMASKFDGKGKPVTKDDFDKLLGHCGAVTDMPCHLFAAELIEFYPDAKIVLVERNIDTWFKSWSTFLDSAFNPLFPMLTKLDPYVTGRIIATGGAGVHYQVGAANTLAAAKARSKEEYKKHYALVRSLTPKDRLLEYKLGEGWEPLCNFLGIDVPKEAFPHVNDSASNTQTFVELGAIASKNAARNVVAVLTAVVVPTAAIIWYLKRSATR